MAWIDEEEKKNMFAYSEKIIVKCNDIAKCMQENTKGKQAIPNIGITYNNKLVQLIRYFENRGVNFYKSPLRPILIRYMSTIVSDALGLLNGYTDLFSQENPRYVSYEEATAIINNSAEILEQFKKMDDKLANFNIEKDIKLAVDSDIEQSRIIGEEGGYDIYSENPETIDTYNSELKNLGIPVRLPEISKDIPTFPNKEEKSLSKQEGDFMNIRELAYQKCEQIGAMFKEKGFFAPNILESLRNRIYDYTSDAANAYKDGNKDMYIKFAQKILSFDIQSEMADSIGRYVAYWADVNSFHKKDGWGEIKKELSILGLDNLVPEIEEKLSTHVYDAYVEERNAVFASSLQETNEEVKKSSF